MMSKANQFRTYWAAGVACLSLFASCSTDEDDGTTLPDGKYPMTFATSVEGLAATRAATADGQWTVGDPIAVQVGGDVKQYTPTTAGNHSATLSAASGTTPFYWQNTNSISVTAWYYGTGYNATSPNGASWAVQSDQSKTEQGSTDDNYQRSDFLYAPATNISFSGRSTTSLSFYHQTARVVINIKNAEAATDAGSIRSVVIGDANNLALSGSYSVPTGEGATAGTWNTSSGSPTMGAITPKKLTAPGTLAGGGTALASYAALVIPQQMKGKKFIAVTLTDDNTYYYTPTQDNDANLKSGKQHTYDITVKHGYLSVTSSASPQWTGDGENITGNGQTVTPGTDGNGSGWIQDGSGETITGTEKNNKL